MDTTRQNNSRTTGSFRALTYLSLFGLAITVPLLLLVGALLLQSASAQRAELESRVLQVLNALVNDIDRELDRDITILHTLATSQALASADWRTFYDEAKAGLQGRAYLVLVDTNGRQLVNTFVLYGKQPALTGDPETVRRILATKAPVVSNLFTSLVVKKPVFNVSIPILDGNQVRYVMSLGLLPDNLLALLQSQKLGSEWLTLIWDAKGVVLARSQDNPRFLGTRLPQNMREQAQPSAVRTANLGGADVLHATALSQVSGWGIGVNVPYSLVTEQMRDSLLLWSAAAVLAITIALVSGVFFARQITTSLSVAAKAAAAFGHGESFPLTGSRLKEADTFLVALENAHEAREKLAEEMKQSRDWLQTAEERMRLTVEAAPNAMIMVSRDGRIELVNSQTERLFGYSREELLGQSVEMLVPKRYRTDHGALRTSFLREPLARPMGAGRDLFGVRKDGTEVPIEIGLNPISTSQGDFVLAAIIDISERKRAEDELRASNTALLRANEDLNQFAFAASHDLQEPLRMVTSYSQLLLKGYRGQLDREAGKCVQFITEGTKRMRELLADLLAYTQVTAEDEQPLEAVDLNRVFENTLVTCKTAIDETGATVTSDRLPTIQAHEPHFLQLFQNLISNSLKYRSERPPQVHVSAERQNGAFRIAFKDNGIGIAPKYHDQIFGVFKRLHGKTIPGTGIGLAICQRVVQRYGGEIRVESNVDEGATFYFTVPEAGGGAAAHEG